MRAAVITFPGSNREPDLEAALIAVGFKPPRRVWHDDTTLPSIDLICLPGGFAHGDYLRCGAIAARSPIMREVARRADDGVLVLGICNGFQVLCEAGLLPGALVRNRQLRFVCRQVELEVATIVSRFTIRFRDGQRIRAPVAHHDGNYVIDPAGLQELAYEDRIAFRYRHNPNGSVGDIAGILNEGRNVLGLMPHLEDASDPLHGSVDGRLMFQSLLNGA